MHEFCQTLALIAPRFIRFPRTSLEVGEAITKFKSDVGCKIPQAFGVVDGTHIEIMAPDVPTKADYFSRLKKYTVNTQVIVGANLMFLDVVTGFSGIAHDPRLWSTSSVGKALASPEGLSKYPEQIIDGVKIKLIILADSAYPLGPQVMKPYPHRMPLTND